MSVAAVFVAFFVSHHVGDYILQTDWQALNKAGGLRRGAGQARRALVSHVTAYTAAFIPALVWMASETGAALAAVLAALIFLPHLVLDDGRLLRIYLVRIKRVGEPVDLALLAAVDQSVHMVSLFAVALLASAIT